MYHEEQVINGVLCWRGTPDGEWTQYTPEALTIALTAERTRAKELETGLYKHMQQVAAARNALAG